MSLNTLFSFASTLARWSNVQFLQNELAVASEFISSPQIHVLSNCDIIIYNLPLSERNKGRPECYCEPQNCSYLLSEFKVAVHLTWYSSPIDFFFSSGKDAQSGQIWEGK